ncbi:MAG: DUF4321 domain-containing protein [Clostridia bacterium]|nr:DUF4321 domain-containing protein [Clostridia bacterium]MBQ3076641.1 DUF4321 domain-containing protein [Clostridia bacterium]
MAKHAKNDLIGLLLLLAGVIIGSFLADLAAGIEWLSWLSYGRSIGIGWPTPITVDLVVIQFTFGLSLHLSVAVILGLAIACWAWRKWF